MKPALALLTALLPLTVYAADAKWARVTSAHFDVYTSESEGEAKSALTHLEAARAFFLAATHSHDPGEKPVRIVVFHSEAVYAKYRPDEVLSAKAYGQAAGTVPATIVVLGLKSDMYEQVFREYTQLVLDDSAPTLPYWFRAGLSMVYSTVKPGDTGMSIGAPPRGSFRTDAAANVSLPLLFGVNREALLASREKGALDFNFYLTNTGSSTEQLAASPSRDPGGAASNALATVQSRLGQSHARAAWMLVHMLIFHAEYRPRFGEFMRTLAAGTETGAAFNRVYGEPVGKVQTDLITYWNQTRIMVIIAPLKFEKTTAAEVHPVTNEERDQILATLK